MKQSSTRKQLPPPKPFLVMLLIGVVVAGISARYLLEGRFLDGVQAQGMRQLAASNGFDLSNAIVPKDQILNGGPGKDGIPAILKPKFVTPQEVTYLRDDDLVVGVVQGKVGRAYPLRILVWHEIVNDTIGDKAVAVTYCPLCGTCMVFERRYDGEELTFGVSGLLYQSDVLLYDYQTESLWSQLKTECIAGKMAGKKLKWLPSEQMTWKSWRKRYPQSQVLSIDTGFRRSYRRQPYGGYEKVEDTMFPVPKYRSELRNKEWVIGIVVNGRAKAYPIRTLRLSNAQPMHDVVGGVEIEITYEKMAQRTIVKSIGDGKRVPHVTVYWFAWQAFHPRTEFFEVK